MTNEVKHQQRIAKRIVEEGQYAKKWATQFAVGVPDLIVVGKPRTIFIEVKLEENWDKDTTRTIGFTEKQKVEAQNINNAGGVCIGLVVVHSKLLMQAAPHAKLCPCFMPAPRNELRVNLQSLSQSSYVWRSRDAIVNGYPHAGSLFEFLNQWYERNANHGRLD